MGREKTPVGRQYLQLSPTKISESKILLDPFSLFLLSFNLQSKELSVGVKKAIQVCTMREIPEKLPLQRIKIEGCLNDPVLPRDAFDRLLNA